MKTITVKQDETTPVATEVLAGAIVAISEGVSKLRRGRIKDDTLCLLIQHASPSYGARRNKRHVTQKEVRAVLDGIDALARTHLKSP